MMLSGLQRLSLIDYPGKVACVVFTLGCNLRCGFCHNPEFVLPEKIKTLKNSCILEEEFFQFLERRRGLLEGVSICGGEPTIHPSLIPFIKKIKSMGYLVKLDTNGSNPKMLEYLIENELVDYIAMDVKHTWQKYHTLVGVKQELRPYQQSVEIIRSRAGDYEFRTTLIGGIHSDEDITSVGEIIRGAKHYFLQKYRAKNVLDPDFHGYTPSDEMLHSWRDALEGTYADSVQIRL